MTVPRVEADSSSSEDFSESEGSTSQAAAGKRHAWKPYRGATPECPLLAMMGCCCAPCCELWWCVRWRALWPMHRRPFGGDYSVGELLIFALFLLYTTSLAVDGFGDHKISAGPLDFCGFLVFATAARNSLLTLLAGVSFERSIVYHKIIGGFTFFYLLYHGYFGMWPLKHHGRWNWEEKNDDWDDGGWGAGNASDGGWGGDSIGMWGDSGGNFTGGGFGDWDDGEFMEPTGPLAWYWTMRPKNSGIVLFCLWTVVVLVTLHCIRRRYFEVFHRCHMAFALLSLPFLYIHNVELTVYGVYLWLIDSALSLATSLCALHGAKTRAATACVLPGDVVMLSFPKKRFQYKAGQWCWLCVPSLGFQFHPFSFSSSPHEDQVTICIRSLGNWTTQLQKLVEKRGKKDSLGKVPLRIFFDGPYGGSRLDIDGNTYESFVLVSGGIGITPMQSLWSELLHQHNCGRHLDHLRFIWAVKDKALASSVGRRVAASAALQRAVSGGIAPDSDEEDSDQVSGSDADAAEAGPALELPLSFTPSLVNISCLPRHAQVEFYLTQVRDEAEYAAAGIDPVAQPHVKLGQRPDFDQILGELAQSLRAKGERRCAVMACGPLAMTEDLRKACRKHSKDKVKFDLHVETFEF